MRFPLLVLLTLLTICSSLFAQGIQINDKIFLDLNMRYRKEIDARYLGKYNGANEYNLLRSQFGLMFQINDKVSVRARFQDSRYMGTTASNQKSSSSLELHEGWMKYDKILDSDISVLLGRYTMQHGRGRVLGADDWNHLGPRAYDGIKVSWEYDNNSINLFAAKIWDRGHDTELTGYEREYWFNFALSTKWDQEIFGIYGNILDGLFQPLILMSSDRNKYERITPEEIRLTEYKSFRVSAGAYSEWTHNNLTLKGEFYQQGGESYNIKNRAFLIAVEAEYEFHSKIRPYFGIGFDITSGQSDGDNNNNNIFITPYASHHEFQGYLDNFTYYRDEGLNDYFIKFGIEPGLFKLDFHFHSFSNRQKLRVNNKSFKYLGNELDTRLQFEMYDNFFVEGVLCLFFPSDEYNSSEHDLSKFFYLTLTAKL